MATLTVGRRCLLLLGLLFLAFTAVPVSAQETEDTSEDPVFTYGLESDLSSRYMWRGLACSQDAVSQNSLWLTGHGLTASLWTNYDLNAVDGDPSLNEFDLGVTYDFSVGALAFTPSVQAYYYADHENIPWTGEMSVTVSTGLFSLQPFMTHSLDIKEYSGAYFGELGIEYGKTLWATGDFHLLAEMGYGSAKFNEAYIGLSESAIQLYYIEGDLSISLSESWYVRPHAGYSWIASDALGDWLEDRSHFQFGIALGGEFSWVD